MTTTSKELIKEAAKSLEEGWCQRQYAELTNGDETDADNVDAVAWCAEGALWKAAETLLPNLRTEQCDAVTEAVGRLTGMLDCPEPASRDIPLGQPILFAKLNEWNDAEGRTQQEVVDLFRRTSA